MDDIRCVTCDCVNVPERSSKTKNNAHLERPRGYCYCTHVGAREALGLRGHYVSKNKNGVGICWTVGASDTPAIKTVPVWCPRKLMYHPMRTSYNKLLGVINSRLPLGLMWAYDPETGRYIGVDNREGEVRTKEFERASHCITWMNSLMSVESGASQFEVEQ